MSQEMESLPLEWKRKALNAFAWIPIEEITTMKIQIKLQVGYHSALKIKDWLATVLD